MDYYTFGMTNDLSFAFIDYFDGIEYHFDLHEGVPMIGRSQNAKAFLDKRYGDFLTDFLSNTSKWVPVSDKVKQIFESLGIDDKEVEFIPLQLFNKNGTIVRKQFYIANPLQKYNCLDLKKSLIKYGEDHSMSRVKVMYIDRARVPANSLFFRLAEAPKLIVIRQDLLGVLRKKGVTGLELIKEGQRIW